MASRSKDRRTASGIGIPGRCIPKRRSGSSSNLPNAGEAANQDSGRMVLVGLGSGCGGAAGRLPAVNQRPGAGAAWRAWAFVKPPPGNASTSTTADHKSTAPLPRLKRIRQQLEKEGCMTSHCWTVSKRMMRRGTKLTNFTTPTQGFNPEGLPCVTALEHTSLLLNHES